MGTPIKHQEFTDANTGANVRVYGGKGLDAPDGNTRLRVQLPDGRATVFTFQEGSGELLKSEPDNKAYVAPDLHGLPGAAPLVQNYAGAVHPLSLEAHDVAALGHPDPVAAMAELDANREAMAKGQPTKQGQEIIDQKNAALEARQRELEDEARRRELEERGATGDVAYDREDGTPVEPDPVYPAPDRSFAEDETPHPAGRVIDPTPPVAPAPPRE